MSATETAKEVVDVAKEVAKGGVKVVLTLLGACGSSTLRDS